jgi:hypothetical protein
MTKLQELKAEIDDIFEKADAAEREYRHLLTLAHYASRLYEIELARVGEKDE